MEARSCCFIGHRKIEDHEAVFEKVKAVVEDLIINQNVRFFYFGSRSEFDDICHRAVTELQERYPFLVRINYNCKSEYVVKKEEKEELERIRKAIGKTDRPLKDFDGAKASERRLRAGRASYVERNEEMIADSDICVFFYREGTLPIAHQKSGTQIAFAYALAKKKPILNLAEG